MVARPIGGRISGAACHANASVSFTTSAPLRIRRVTGRRSCAGASPPPASEANDIAVTIPLGTAASPAGSSSGTLAMSVPPGIRTDRTYSPSASNARNGTVPSVEDHGPAIGHHHHPGGLAKLARAVSLPTVGVEVAAVRGSDHDRVKPVGRARRGYLQHQTRWPRPSRTAPSLRRLSTPRGRPPRSQRPSHSSSAGRWTTSWAARTVPPNSQANASRAVVFLSICAPRPPALACGWPRRKREPRGRNSTISITRYFVLGHLITVGKGRGLVNDGYS